MSKDGEYIKETKMPLKGILEIEIFDVWGIDFMGPFPTSLGYKYILVMDDYVSKWVEAMPTLTNDAKVVLENASEINFPEIRYP